MQGKHWAAAMATLRGAQCPHGLASADYCARCVQPVATQIAAEEDVKGLRKRLSIVENDTDERLTAIENALDMLFETGGADKGRQESANDE